MALPPSDGGRASTRLRQLIQRPAPGLPLLPDPAADGQRQGRGPLVHVVQHNAR